MRRFVPAQIFAIMKQYTGHNILWLDEQLKIETQILDEMNERDSGVGLGEIIDQEHRIEAISRAIAQYDEQEMEE